MTDIHYFPRYSQRENFVTNNTLLLFLRLYQFNRWKFQTFMEKLCADEPGVQISTSWLHFQQQKGTGKSVLDGFISQDSIKIAVETKLVDYFDPAQLENHLAVFENEQHKLLIMLSPGEIPDSAIASIRASAIARNIQVIHTSFEDIVRIAKECLSGHDEEMQALIDDYESFCSESDLLPKDKYLLFVPPCGVSFEDNLQFALYYCDVTWNRRKARYLGIYAERAVRAIGRIAKVVACDVDLSANKVAVKDGDITLTAGEEQRVLGATKNAQKHGWDLSKGDKFYLCDELAETDFRKVSSGGIMGHRYFDLRQIVGPNVPNNATALATLLRGRVWPENQN
jgi:hypothetical protein